MHIVSWNVNGIRAVVNKNFIAQVNNELGTPDIICLQETKAQDDQVVTALTELKGYHIYTNSAEKKGYSGVAILSKQQPLEVRKGIGVPEHDTEGRVLAARFEHFWLVTVYTPNSQNGLARLPYRETWDTAFLDFLLRLDQEAPLVICGDLNVAHQRIDIARPDANYNKSAGFTQKEIDGLQALLNQGFIDTFRYLHPEVVRYSWWSYRANARMKNIGWRIDYFLTSKRMVNDIRKADILTDVTGSDHCPIALELSVS